jgi:DNA repair proteins
LADIPLRQLAGMTANELIKEGLTEIESVRLVTAFEIGRRVTLTDVSERPQIRSSRDVYNLLYPVDLRNAAVEHFFVLCLNRANKVLAIEHISSGSTSGTLVDPRVIARRTLAVKAVSSLILVHNHPSGNCQPSQTDIDLTKKIKAGFKLLDMKVLDHVIITSNGYYSFADNENM